MFLRHAAASPELKGYKVSSKSAYKNLKQVCKTLIHNPIWSKLLSKLGGGLRPLTLILSTKTYQKEWLHIEHNLHQFRMLQSLVQHLWESLWYLLPQNTNTPTHQQRLRTKHIHGLKKQETDWEASPGHLPARQMTMWPLHWSVQWRGFLLKVFLLTMVISNTEIAERWK